MLENFCYALHNIGQMKERPAGLKGEIFDLLFESAEISKFAVHEKAKYFEDMTTQEDIKRMIAFAEDRGVEKGMEKEKLMAAKIMKDKGYPVSDTCEIVGLTPEVVSAL